MGIKILSGLFMIIFICANTGKTVSGKTSSGETAPSNMVSATVKKANEFDYVSDSVTGLSKKNYSKEKINELIKGYGRFEGALGMPFKEYKKAMKAEWVDRTQYNKWGKKPAKVKIDISKSYTYDKLVKFMTKLSTREGVYLYDIGSTTSGRRMYALEIDVPSKKKKTTVVLTGSIHARETAGSIYILKEISALLQSDSDEAREILQTVRFAIVPCVNPDGREGVAFDTANYKYSDGKLWKGTSDGTDLNRNFPGLVWSQIKKGYSRTESVTSNPKKVFYPGEYAGSCNETKAMMKFLYHFIVLEKARVLIDYHQQGRVAYAGKPWQNKAQQKRCKDLANFLFKRMNVGNKNKYCWESEETEYGLDGCGSTLTDYAVSLALGAKFSPGYGFMVYTDGKKEYPLVMIPRLEETKLDVLAQTNKKFATTTLEIGYGQDYLGYSGKTRKLQKEEYNKYHFDKLLYYLKEYIG